MIKPVRILGIAGSLRRESYNRAVLRAATQLMPEGASIEIFELDPLWRILSSRASERSRTVPACGALCLRLVAAW